MTLNYPVSLENILLLKKYKEDNIHKEFKTTNENNQTAGILFCISAAGLYIPLNCWLC